MIYAAGGDFTYIQWGIGSIIARIIVGIYFVRVFYQREIYSPYDYMGNRLGENAKRLATLDFPGWWYPGTKCTGIGRRISTKGSYSP